ncbi:MAG: T9SS type A sorting domain-containing protein [Bacteroidetes bacterium]|nr:T9SS type A sorting domain-containing protein [Bacteroidota bacterium]
MKTTITILALSLCIYAKAQNISTYAGTGASGFSGDGGQATSSVLKNPTGVAVDNQGNVYVADSYNSRIRKINASTGVITTVVGSGSYGFAGDGGPATAASMTYPIDVAVDSQGNLYIADNANYRIRKVTVSTGIITTIAGNGTSTPTGDGGLATAAQVQVGQLTIDAQNNLYISAGDRIRKINASTGIITTVAGTGISGYSGDGGLATAAQLNATGGVIVDANGNIYIADQGNHRVRKVNASTGIITTIVNQLGSNSYFGDGGSASAAGITGPYGLALDSQGNLYIADQNDNRIRKVDAITGIITTIAGTGTGNFSGDGGPATAAELFFPGDLAIDTQNNVYITEGYALSPVKNYRIRKISNGITGIEQFSSNKGQVTIYPNPFSAQITFDLKENSGKETTVIIYNSIGQIVRTEKSSSEKITIQRENLGSGVYFYKLISESKMIDSGKIMAE